MAGLTRILVPTDFSDAADAALADAKALSRLFGASLHVLHVFEDPYATGTFAPEVYAPLPPDVREGLLRDIEARLAERITDADRQQCQAATEIVTGPTAKKIVDYAVAHGVDLIAMGTHGRTGLAHLLLGSVAERVLRTAPCPVLTRRDTMHPTITRVLVPTDFSAASDAALDYARVVASRFNATVHLLHVVENSTIIGGMEPSAADTPGVRSAMLEDARSRLSLRAHPAGVPAVADSEVIFGVPEITIVEYARARDASLIVMGTHGRTGVAHLLMGSVAEKVVRTAPCPVLTVREARVPREHVSVWTEAAEAQIVPV